MLKLIYALFLGLLLATFVGVGVATFYHAPKYPDYPPELEQTTPGQPSTSDQKLIDQKNRDDQKKYQADSTRYNRNASTIVLAFAIIFLALGLLLAHRIDIIADGLVLGGIFSLLYSIGRGFASDDVTYQFIVVSVAVVIALVLGYLKFIKPSAKQT